MFADYIKAHNFQASIKGKEGGERNREIQLREIVRQTKKRDKKRRRRKREKEEKEKRD